MRQQVNINEMDFGFASGCRATDGISFLRQLQYHRLCNKNYFYLPFWDAVWWALRNTAVQVSLAMFVQSMHRSARSRVRVNWFFSIYYVFLYNNL